MGWGLIENGFAAVYRNSGPVVLVIGVGDHPPAMETGDFTQTLEAGDTLRAGLPTLSPGDTFRQVQPALALGDTVSGTLSAGDVLSYDLDLVEGTCFTLYIDNPNVYMTLVDNNDYRSPIDGGGMLAFANSIMWITRPLISRWKAKAISRSLSKQAIP